MRSRIQALFAIPPLLCIVAASSVIAQEEPESKKAASIQLRVLCGQPVVGTTELDFVQDDTTLTSLSLRPSMVSDPFGVGRGELVLARQAAAGEAPDPFLKLNIPEVGSRFVLALFPAPDADAKTPYRHVLIRTDSIRFGISDLFLFNLTRTQIGGSLGETTFYLAPGKSEVVTPAPDSSDERMYQARFYIPQEDGKRLFGDTRWPLSASARVYIFFIPDPARRTISYLSFREYAPFE